MCFVTSTIRAGPTVDASDCLLTLTWPTNSAASWQPAQTGGLILSGSYQMDTCARAGAQAIDKWVGL